MQCRACRRLNCEEAMDMSYVVSTDGKTLYDYFNYCTQLRATSKDDLPKMLCIHCTQNLRQAYNFRQEARRSDEELKQILALAKKETALVCEPVVQSEVLEDIETSTFDQLSLSPKKEIIFYPEHSNGLEDIEIGVPTKIESSLVYESIEQSEILERCKINQLWANGRELSTSNLSFYSLKSVDEDIAEGKFIHIDFHIAVLPRNKEVDISDMVEATTFDPLSASGYSGQSETKSSTAISDHQHELNILNEEIKIELSTEVFEDKNERHFEESSDDGYEDNSEIFAVSSRKTYFCDLCVYQCRQQSEFKKHIFELHKDTIICEKCSKVFELPRETQLHIKLVHDTDSDMCCHWCKNSSPMPNCELAKHIQMKHRSNYLKYFPRSQVLCRGENDPFQCERCQKCFKTIYELADHKKEHKFDCKLCSMTFKNINGYRSHKRSKHNPSIIGLKSMLTVKDDINMHFRCSLCTKQYQFKKSLQKHVESKHKEYIYKSQNDINSKDQPEKSVTVPKVEEEYENDELVKCKHCHREIPASRIFAHEKRHSNKLKNQKKYICSYCSREFKSSSSVKLHERSIHQCDEPKRKECPICQKNVVAYYLKSHITEVHPSERKFTCEICGDSFKSNTQLRYHKKLHLDRKVSCTICNKGCISASDLKIHMRMHTGERPYACHICDRRFKIKSQLNYHLQRHAGIKRKCNVCGKEFNHIAQLKNHSYKHTGMPYRCSVCDYKCAKRQVFRQHLLRMHDMTMTDAEYRAMFKANTGRNPRVLLAKDLERMDEVTQVE